MNKKDIEKEILKPIEFIKLNYDCFSRESIYTDGKVTKVGGREGMHVYKVENASYITKVRYEQERFCSTHVVAFMKVLKSAKVYIPSTNYKESLKLAKAAIYDANERAEAPSLIPLSISMGRLKSIAYNNDKNDLNVMVRKL